MQEKAHFYVDLGLKIIPIKPGTKVPLTTHGSLDASNDHEKVQAWWERWPSANIGIATGHIIDVIDLDGWEAQTHFDLIQDQPEILGAVMTPRDGGLHVYVSATGLGNRTGLLPGIDYRGKGGYVLAPPSKIISNDDHDYAGEYEWIDDLDLSKITDGYSGWIPEEKKTNEIRTKANGAPKATNGAPFAPDDHKEDDQVRVYLDSAIRQETDAILQASKGNRNHVLNTSAFSLGQLTPHYLDRSSVRELIIHSAKQIGLPMREIVKTVDHALDDGAKQPREPKFHDHSPDVSDVDLDEWLENHGDQGIDDHQADDLETIWAMRPELLHIREFALSRMVSPWATLGVVIMRVLTSVPPWVMLPAYVGGNGNLNAFLSLVGASGTGKDAAVRCGADAFKIIQRDHDYRVRVLPVGTGEGMIDQFATMQMIDHDDGKGKVPTQVAHDDPKVLFTGLEVNMIKALTLRSGATLMEMLKMAFSGSQLGFTYRNKGQGSAIIDADEYRLCMIIGAQPENIESLLDDSNGGFPQRMVWLPSTDSNIKIDRPGEPPAWVIEDQKWPVSKIIISCPKSVETIILTAREKRMQRGIDEVDENDLEGHLNYVQLKVAAGLMIIAGRRMMIEEDWAIAELIMRKSLQTRDAARRMIKKKHEKKKIAAHKDAAVRVKYEENAKFEETEKQEKTRHDQVKDKIKTLLKDGPKRTRDLQHANRSKLYKEVLEEMVNDHEVTIGPKDGERGRWAYLN